MIDYILEIVYDSGSSELEDAIQTRLYMSASTGSSQADGGPETVLSAYFESEEDREACAATLTDLGVELRQLERERIDWLDRYEQSLEPLYIGASFIVAPDVRLVPPGSGRFSIIVPQELAFGTGSHETTALCIELLEELIPSQEGDIPLSRAFETVEVSLASMTRRGLDVGTGSGILAIAMLRLGLPRVIAFDNDLDAFGPLRDNRIRNFVSEQSMPVFIGGVEALGQSQFDFVTMNIIPEVILPLLPAVVALVAPGGTLMLSGILTVRRDDVVAAVEAHGFSVVAERTRGEWWAGAVKR